MGEDDDRLFANNVDEEAESRNWDCQKMGMIVLV